MVQKLYGWAIFFIARKRVLNHNREHEDPQKDLQSTDSVESEVRKL